MLDAIVTACLVMVSASLAVNLGLSDAVASVTGKILRCPTCLTFWSAFIVLISMGEDILLSGVLSIASAYLSNYFGLLLGGLNQTYERLWQQQRRKPPHKSRRHESRSDR